MGFRLQEVPGVQAQGREGMGMVGGGGGVTWRRASLWEDEKVLEMMV